MSIADTDVKAKYNGDGSTTTFAIPHAIVETAADEVEVMLVDETATPPTETIKTITTHYTISGSNVIFNTAPGATEKVLISRKMALIQEQDIDVNAAFPAAATEVTLDKLVAMIQMISEKVDRAVKWRKSYIANTNPDLPDPSASKALVWNSGATDLENGPSTSEISNAQTYALAAQAAQTAAELAQTNAETAETNAETAETNAETAETNAEAAQAAAEAAQAAAEAAAQAVIWSDVVFLTFADSPVTIGVNDYGKLYAVDTTGGNVAITLPAIAGLDLSFSWSIGVKKTDSSGNTVTITRASTDTIDGATSKTLEVQNQYAVLVPDTDSAPDQWTALDGGAGNAVTATSTFGNDNRLVRTDGTGRGAQATGITVDDSDNTTIPGTLTVQGATIAAASATTVTLGTSNSNTTASIASGSGTNTVTIGGASTTTTSTGQFNHDNLRLDGNDISSTNTDGNITLTPNGTGIVDSSANITAPTLKTDTDGSQSAPCIQVGNEAGHGLYRAAGGHMTHVANNNPNFSSTQTGFYIHRRQPLIFYWDAGGVSRTINFPASGASHNLILPGSQGSFGQVLTNDGSGNLSWSPPASGGINFITYGDAENNATTGWATYADAAATSPADGTGGSANITLAASSSSPLRGTYSFLITKDAANRQGEGVSYDFTTAAADDNKKLSISWDYEASANYTGSSGSEYMTCYVYDVTNATVIATSNVNIPYGSGSQQITFDATTSNSYRLCFHVAGTGTSSWTYKFDNVKVGPQEAIIAPAIGDWQSYTTTTGLTGGTTTFTAYYRRVGDSLEMSVIANFASVFTGGTATFTLPSGLAIDTTKFSATPTAGSTLLGQGTIYDTSTTDSYPCQILYQTTTTVLVRVHQDDFGTGSNYVTYSGISTTIPMTWANGDLIQFTARMPIANWSSNIQLANSRVEYASNSGMGDANDTSSFVNDPNGSPMPVVAYTANRYKTVRFKNPIQASDSIKVQLKLSNGSWVDLCGLINNGTTSHSDYFIQNTTQYGFGRIDPISSGNNTDVAVYFARYRVATGASWAAAGSDWDASDTGRWRVVKYSNAVPVEVQTVPVARYSTDAGQSIDNGGSGEVIDFEDRSIDTHGLVTTGASWKWTANRAGYVRVSAKAALSNTSGWAVGEIALLGIRKNASEASRQEFCITYAGTQEVNLSVSDIISVNPGDYIDVIIYHNNGSAVALQTSSIKNSIAIEYTGS